MWNYLTKDLISPERMKTWWQHGIAKIAGYEAVSGSLPRFGFCHGGK